jgi:hypothetical protein
MDRQYCAFAGIRHGQKTHDFFADLVHRRLATVYRIAHGRARLFHLRRRSLYDAIGEPDSRLRRPTPIARTIERMLILDEVLATRDITWLATINEKITHFTSLLDAKIDCDELPYLTCGEGDTKPRGTFQTSCLSACCRTCIRTCSRTWSIVPYRSIFGSSSVGTADSLRALPRWTIRLLVPAHLADTVGLFEAASREEFASRLRPSTADELRWYFEARRQLEQRSGVPQEFARLRYARARDPFGALQYQVLYRTWLRQGPSALRDHVSPLLADAIARGTGQLDTQVLAHPYPHLARRR